MLSPYLHQIQTEFINEEGNQRLEIVSVASCIEPTRMSPEDPFFPAPVALEQLNTGVAILWPLTDSSNSIYLSLEDTTPTVGGPFAVFQGRAYGDQLQPKTAYGILVLLGVENGVITAQTGIVITPDYVPVPSGFASAAPNKLHSVAKSMMGC